MAAEAGTTSPTCSVLAPRNAKSIARTLASAAGIGAGVLTGVLNGFLIVRLNLPPFIVTLGTLSIFSALTLILFKARTIHVATRDKYLIGDLLTLQVTECFGFQPDGSYSMRHLSVGYAEPLRAEDVTIGPGERQGGGGGAALGLLGDDARRHLLRPARKPGVEVQELHEIRAIRIHGLAVEHAVESSVERGRQP